MSGISPPRPKPKRPSKPSPVAFFRAIFGAPKRRFLGAPRSYVNKAWDHCRAGRLPNGGVYELAYNRSAATYHVTVLRTTATTRGVGIDRDREHDREFGCVKRTTALILRARDEALRYLVKLGAKIPDREFLPKPKPTTPDPTGDAHGDVSF